MLNNISLVGRIAQTPELKVTSNQKHICSFNVACTRDRAGADGQKETDFIPCFAVGKSGEFVSKYFQKGSMIALSGRLQTRKYQDKSGNNRTAFDVFATEISFCGGKSDSSSDSNADASMDAPRPTAPAQERKALNDDDFRVIDESDDLPF